MTAVVEMYERNRLVAKISVEELERQFLGKMREFWEIQMLLGRVVRVEEDVPATEIAVPVEGWDGGVAVDPIANESQ